MFILNYLKKRAFTIKLIVLICLLGTGSWVEINGLWVELPVLVTKSPQQWTLPSYLTIVIQLANIGPLLYLLANKYVRKNSRKVVTEIPAIYLILSVGVVASFLLAFLWDKTSMMNGKLYSTSLIALSFFLALVDCTSSVTFLPFMANFPKEYMTAFYVGEGLSGFFPSVIALIQGVGKQSYTCETKVTLKNVTLPPSIVPPMRSKQVNVTSIVPSYFQTEARFSAQVFFILISVMMLCSLVSFILLVRIKQKFFNSNESAFEKNVDPFNEDSCELKETKYLDDSNAKLSEYEEPGVDSKAPVTLKPLAFLLLINAVINGMSNGVLPSLQSYACLPYGNKIYHLTLALSAFANPWFCFLYFFLPVQSTLKITFGAGLYLLTACYTVSMAATSPCPLWSESETGGVVVLVVTVLGVGLVSYLKTAISTVLRKSGYKALMWNGISVQVGSLVGALTIFPLVNVYDVFQQAEPCQQC